MKRLAISFSLLLVLFCSCSPEKESEGLPELVRKPYLQSAIADSVSILWRTNIGQEARVDYRVKGENNWQTATGLTRKTNTNLIENEVVLKQLKPNTVYEYSVFTNHESPLNKSPYHFTSPVPATDSVFSFFAVGDIGEPVDDGGTPDKLGEALAPFVDSLRFGLLLGDIIYPDGKSEVYDENLFQYFGSVFPYVPVFTVLGNHDWHEPKQNYMKEWKLPGNEHYYSFDYGNVHFTALDTKNGEMHDYDKQVEWLKEDLANIPESAEWRVVFLHHNGRSCTYKDDYEAVVSLYTLFDEYDVDLVLNGHAHTYERLRPMNANGPTMEQVLQDSIYSNPTGFVSITVGSGGKLRGIGSDPTPWEPSPENCDYPNLVAACTHDWAFLKLDVNGKVLTGTAITTEGNQVVDRFSIEKN